MNLEIQNVKDKGDSEKERLVLKALKNLNTKGYVVMDATFDSDGDVVNKGRHAYKFPSKEIKQGDYVVLYTRAIKADEKTEIENTARTTTHNFYWKRTATVWNQGGDNCSLMYMVHSKTV